MDVAQFHAAPGVEDWRMLGNGLHVRYRCDGLAQGASLAAAIADAGLASDPQIDLRRGSVTIRLPAHEQEFVDDDDLAAAQWIQQRARAYGLIADPRTLRQIQIAVAHAPGVEVAEFWRAVSGYVPLGEEDAQDPEERNPRLWFHEIDGGAAGRGRTHIDIYVPAEEAQSIVDAACAAGGRIADGSHAPDWWTLASPDNHGVDIASWPDRG